MEYEDSRAVARKINSEVVLLLGWGRAILLLLAHPLVAVAVAEHSSVKAAPRLRLQRLRQTIEAMLALTFGSPEEVHRASQGINAIHDRVHGRLAKSAGSILAETEYSAHDSKLLGWVHCTLLDSLLLTYELYVGPLSLEEKDRYCAEARILESLLGIPAGSLPETVNQLHDYLEERLASEEIVVTEDARSIAEELVSPNTWSLVRPLIWFITLPAVGLLPSRIRLAYGYRWTRGHRIILKVSAATVRALLPLVSSRFRHWPQASAFWFSVLERSERVFKS